MEKIMQSFGFVDLDQFEDSPCQLYDFGIQKREEETYFYDNGNRGSYEGFIFQYTLDGGGVFEQQGVVQSVRKQTAFLVSLPQDSRYYVKKEVSESWTFFYLHFQGLAAKEICQKIVKQFGNLFFLDERSDVLRLFMEEYQQVQAGKNYERYEGSLFLYRFLLTLLKDLETPYQSQKNPHVEQALFLLKRDYAKEIHLSQMAESLGISLEHLSRIFKEHTGFTLMSFLTNLRMERAIWLLRNSDLSIHKVGEACGYSSGNYFGKVFMKIMGVTPNEYRNR